MFVFVLVVSVFIALSRVNLETLRGEVSTALSDAVGMPVEIRGKIYWKFSLSPRVALSDVAIKSKDWATYKDGVSIDLVEARLNLFSLFGAATSVRDVVLINPVVHLEENSKGEYSLDSAHQIETHGADGEPAEFPIDTEWGIDSIRMENPKFVYIRGNEIKKFDAEKIYLKYKKSSDYMEYTGRVSLDGNDYSFIASLSQLDTERKVYPVRLVIANKYAPLTANIALEQTSLIPIDFLIRGKIVDAYKVFNQTGVTIPKIGEMTINIAGGMDHEKLTLRQSAVSFGKSDVLLSGSYSWGEKLPNLNLKLKSQKFILDEVFPNLYGGSQWQRPNRELNVFKDMPLYSGLDDMTADIKIDIASMNVYRDMFVDNINANADLHKGLLSINLDSNFADGEISAVIKSRKDSIGMVTDFVGRGRGIVFGEIMKSIRQKNFVDGLPLDFDFYIQGHGDNMSEFMANANGPLQIRSAGGGTALPDAAEYIYGKDFLTSVRHSVQDIVTARQKYNKVAISCASVNLKIRNGRAETTRGVAIQTRDVNMLAVGYVDLGAEDMQVSLASTPVRGIRLSITGSLLNAMEFKGNMAEPDIRLNNSAMIGKAATTAGIGMLALAPFTGGLSLVAGVGGFFAGDLLNNWLADENPCETALNIGAPAKDDDPTFMNRSPEELVGEFIK